MWKYKRRSRLMRGARTFPFVDRKVYEYTRNLLGSSYLKSKPEGVFDFLKDVVGEEFLSKTLRDYFIEGRGPNANISPSMSNTDFGDFRDIRKQLSCAALVKALQRIFPPFFDAKIKKILKTTPTDKKLEKLGKLFRFEKAELEIITFLYLLSETQVLNQYFTSSNCLDDYESAIALTNRLHEIVGCNRSAIQRAFSKGNFIKCGIIEREGRRSGNNSLADWIVEYLSEIGNDEIAGHFFEKFKGKALEMKEHLINPEESEVLQELLQSKNSGINVLFFGTPGTGKTELAKSLASALKKELLIINKEKKQEVSDLKSAIIATSNIADPAKSIILVDEADAILNSEFSYFFTGERNDKSWINAFLDENRQKMIWITNATRHIGPSTMRRFAFSMEFKNFGVRKKIKVFENVLRRHGLSAYFSQEELKTLCSRYSVNAGGIADLIKNIGIQKRSNKERIMKKIHVVLRNHEVAITGKRVKKGRMKEMGEYSLKALNASEDLNATITIMKNFLAKRENGGLARPSNMNLLFYGPPGTGKTEFAKYLASALSREIVLKRASDLISCWVGETEKLIADAFGEAEEDEAILFLDEADSFLYPRQNAARSWEMTQTNELLTQMENFKGVLICATNFKKGLDEAALRRFKFKIEFKPLSPEGNLELYRTVLAPLCKRRLGDNEAARMKAFKNLTPGDFHIVAEKFSLVDGPISHEQLLLSLEEETRHKTRERTIGFESHPK